MDPATLLAAAIGAAGSVFAAAVSVRARAAAKSTEHELHNGTSNQLDRIEAKQAEHGERLNQIESRQAQVATGQTQLATVLGAHMREAEQQWRKGNET